MPDQSTIVISRDDAQRVITALRITADTYRRASRTRANSGPNLAPHRAYLRDEAAKMSAIASRIVENF